MVEIKKIPESRIVMEIFVTSEEVQKYKNEALGILGQQVKLEGFRKGRVPLNILKENIDKDKWLIETVDVAINNKYYEIVVANKDKYLVIGSPKIDFKSKIDFDSIDDGISFTAEVDVYPEVSLPDLSKIKVEQQKAVVLDEDFEKSKDLLLKKRSTLSETQEGYKTIKGDWIDIDYEVEIDGRKISDAGTKSFPLIIGNKIMTDGFEEYLLEHRAGDEFDFVLKVDSDYRDKRLAGKDVKFYVKVNDIKKLVVPEFNDDFVISLAIDGVNTTDAFKKYMMENLLLEKERGVEENVKNEILGKIEAGVQIELPVSLVEQELDMMWHEFEHNLKDKGIATDDYLKRENVDMEKIKEGWREQANKRVRFGLIIRELIKSLDIKVDDKSVNDYLEKRMSIIKQDLVKHAPDSLEKMEQEYRKKLFSEEYKKRAEQELVIDKMFDVLKSMMVVEK